MYNPRWKIWCWKCPVFKAIIIITTTKSALQGLPYKLERLNRAAQVSSGSGFERLRFRTARHEFLEGTRFTRRKKKKRKKSGINDHVTYCSFSSERVSLECSRMLIVVREKAGHLGQRASWAIVRTEHGYQPKSGMWETGSTEYGVSSTVRYEAYGNTLRPFWTLIGMRESSASSLPAEWISMTESCRFLATYGAVGRRPWRNNTIIVHDSRINNNFRVVIFGHLFEYLNILSEYLDIFSNIWTSWSKKLSGRIL